VTCGNRLAPVLETGFATTDLVPTWVTLHTSHPSRSQLVRSVCPHNARLKVSRSVARVTHIGWWKVTQKPTTRTVGLPQFAADELVGTDQGNGAGDLLFVGPDGATMTLALTQ
jgi:hypothetical protein